MKAKAFIGGLTLLLAGLSACAADPQMPQSVYQWERRQQRIEQDWIASQGQKAQAAVTAQETSTNGASAPEDHF